MTWDEIRGKLTRKFPNLTPERADELADFCLVLYERGRQDAIRKALEMISELPMVSKEATE